MKCPNCLSETPRILEFCQVCGKTLPRIEPGTLSHDKLPIDHVGASVELRFAKFWKRAVALFIDMTLLIIVASFVSGDAARDDLRFRYAFGILGLVYYVAFENSPYMGTLGKIIMKLRVVDVSGNKISVGRAVIRYIARNLSNIILMLGYIVAAFTEKNQTLHDLIAKTYVIEAESKN